MSSLVVVDEEHDWPLACAGVEVLSARRYLSDAAGSGKERALRVYNLCSACHYQSLGYYVSLLAEARGQQPWPPTGTLEDLHSPPLVNLLTTPLAGLVEHSLACLDGPELAPDFELPVYFGRSPVPGHELLAATLFAQLQVPLLCARFARRSGRWHSDGVRLVSLPELSAAQCRLAFAAAAAHFAVPRRPPAGSAAAPFGMAILHAPGCPDVPSNPDALDKFAAAASALGMRPEFITEADYGRLDQFDALFIRDTTFVHHYTYRFARRAEGEGLVVIDDADSILKCNNKVYLAELLTRHGLPTPRSLLIHHANTEQIVPLLGLPCVLKQPDSAFSVGVLKVDSEPALQAALQELFAKSALIVAQEWLPTEFDWRVGILDRRVLFVCRYYMAEGHWQIIHRDSGNGRREGRTEALAVGEAPAEVLRLALAATDLIGRGFYGVDIKQSGKRFCIIEINDNPNVDAGNEDAILGDALYRETMGVFLRRLRERGGDEAP